MINELCKDVAVIVIGRNEGERLKLCVLSIQKQHDGPIIYVDSGSTDGSVAFAHSVGIDVIDLDLSIPFTMARGRNAGFYKLIESDSQCRYIQFVDGDCELDNNWLNNAVGFLDEKQDVSCVCGLLREKAPDKNIYHRILNMEWNSGNGEIEACGGIAMYRVDALKSVGVFDETLIAGEELELCLRLRDADWKIWRLNKSMGTHDANMNKFSQWWTRAVRGGYTYAQGYFMGSKGKNKHKRKQLLSALGYGCILPSIVIISVSLFGGQDITIFLLASIMLIYLRVFISTINHRKAFSDSLQNTYLYALFMLIAKFPESLGIFTFIKNKLIGKTTLIMEYRDDNKKY